MTTRKKCEQYAAQHNLTIDYESHYSKHSGRSYSYSVDLPDGMITEDGYTGKGGESECSDHTAAEVWAYILDDMRSLVEQEWITLEEYEARQKSA